MTRAAVRWESRFNGGMAMTLFVFIVLAFLAGLPLAWPR
jgi:hypothetical protein